MKNDFYSVYAPGGDMTFVMKDTYNKKNELISTECVGFYYGEPDAESDKYFVGKLKAKYDWRI